MHLMIAVLSMVKWLINVVMPISGAAKRCWISQDRKVEFLVMPYQEVCNVFYVTVKIIIYTSLFTINCVVEKQENKRKNNAYHIQNLTMT